MPTLGLTSIIIPTARDKHLQQTVDDLKQKAGGDIEIIVIENKPMRVAINEGVKQATGEFIMKCDSHCVFGEEYDTILKADIQDDWVVSPRRYKLDVEKWEVMDDPPIDYMRIYRQHDKLHGSEDRERTERRKDIMVDENMIFQGSCWFMTRKWWDKMFGELSSVGYGNFTQEPQEICLKTWLGGGKVMVNKNTWYAHKHRKFRRTVHLDSDEIRNGNAWSRDYWLNNRWPERIHDYQWLKERFDI